MIAAFGMIYNSWSAFQLVKRPDKIEMNKTTIKKNKKNQEAILWVEIYNQNYKISLQQSFSLIPNILNSAPLFKTISSPFGQNFKVRIKSQIKSEKIAATAAIIKKKKYFHPTFVIVRWEPLTLKCGQNTGFLRRTLCTYHHREQSHLQKKPSFLPSWLFLLWFTERFLTSSP